MIIINESFTHFKNNRLSLLLSIHTLILMAGSYYALSILNLRINRACHHLLSVTRNYIANAFIYVAVLETGHDAFTP